MHDSHARTLTSPFAHTTSGTPGRQASSQPSRCPMSRSDSAFSALSVLPVPAKPGEGMIMGLGGLLIRSNWLISSSWLTESRKGLVVASLAARPPGWPVRAPGYVLCLARRSDHRCVSVHLSKRVVRRLPCARPAALHELRKLPCADGSSQVCSGRPSRRCAIAAQAARKSNPWMGQLYCRHRRRRLSLPGVRADDGPEMRW